MKHKGDLKLAAEKWKQESEEVKKEYEKLAKEEFEKKRSNLSEFC